jgi:hypothetical protein
MSAKLKVTRSCIIDGFHYAFQVVVIVDSTVLGLVGALAQH